MPYIKASKRKEKHDELLDRTASLVLAIIGNVLDVSLHGLCEQASIGHEFQEPFGEDVSDDIDNILKAYDGGIQSRETSVEQNPLVKDVTRELERLKAEQEERQQQQMSIFGDAAGAGAQSYGDGSEDEEDEEDGDESKKKEDNKKKKKSEE